MGMFDGIDAVSSSSGGAFIVPGKYRFRINALKCPDNLRAGQCFIAELDLVSSNVSEFFEGQRISWIRKLGGEWAQLALADVKGFIAAAAKCEESQINNEVATRVVQDDQPLAGKLVDCEAYNKPKKNGEPFTRTRWSPVEDE